MSSTLTAPSLQRRIDEMQQPRLGARALPTSPELGSILPDGALRAGAMYSMRGSWQLALAFLSEASRGGAWCGVLGCPSFGGEAAASLGIALDRCVVVPEPGRHALSIASTLGETLSLVVARFEHRVSSGDVERLAARLREHGSALIVAGEWPRTESRLTVVSSQWSGLGTGHGMLDDRTLTVRSEDRRGTRHHALRFSREGVVEASALPADVSAVDREGSAPRRLLRAV